MNFTSTAVLFAVISLIAASNKQCTTIIGCIQCPDPKICEDCDVIDHFQNPPVEGRCYC
jgi:hypothetical protein